MYGNTDTHQYNMPSIQVLRCYNQISMIEIIPHRWYLLYISSCGKKRGVPIVWKKGRIPPGSVD